MNISLYFNRKNLLALLLAPALFLTPGCESFVEVDLPSSQLNADAVFEDKASAEAAVANIYARLRDNGMLFGNLSGISNAMGTYADELAFYGGSSDVSQQFYTNNLVPSNGSIRSWWNEAYSLIYSSNAVIEGVAASTALTGSEKARLSAEALFLRSLLHFYLANLFGPVPYVTTTDYRANSTIGRSSVDQIYQNAIGDLNQAVLNLPEPDQVQRSRANKAIATALLARIYLYNSNYAEAADAASYIINNQSTYHFTGNIQDAFLKESTEAIWHLTPKNEGQNTAEGAGFIFVSGPPPQVALSGELINAFEPEDLRRVHWVKGISDGAATWYHPYKYKERTVTGTSLEYSIVLRLSEQYLIRAEARALEGNLIGAKEDLDKVRLRAGLGSSPAATQPELLTAIIQERRLELFTEFGHRFFDLKRTGLLDAALEDIKPGWQATDQLLPIPENEMIVNPNLAPQNPGY